MNTITIFHKGKKDVVYPQSNETLYDLLNGGGLETLLYEMKILSSRQSRHNYKFNYFYEKKKHFVFVTDKKENLIAEIEIKK